MQFKEYFDSLSADEQEDLAIAADTSRAYLSQVANGHRNAGAGLIGRLMKADEKISFEMMRPSDEARASA